jgi:hypothetical protein
MCVLISDEIGEERTPEEFVPVGGWLAHPIHQGERGLPARTSLALVLRLGSDARRLAEVLLMNPPEPLAGRRFRQHAVVPGDKDEGYTLRPHDVGSRRPDPDGGRQPEAEVLDAGTVW